jgi:hypothetical protein
MLFLIAFLLTLLGAQETECDLYTQEYWLSNEAAWPESLAEATLCGTAWPTLMAVEAFQVASENDALWVIAFHQLAQATLNSEASDEPANAALNASLWYVQDALEHQCNAVSQWSETYANNVQLGEALGALVTYNRHVASNAACNASDTTPFSFLGDPQLFLPVLGAGAPIDAATVDTLYQRVLILMITTCVATVLILLLVIAVIMLKRRSREYSLVNTDTATHIELETRTSDTTTTASSDVTLDGVRGRKNQ